MLKNINTKRRFSLSTGNKTMRLGGDRTDHRAAKRRSDEVEVDR